MSALILSYILPKLGTELLAWLGPMLLGAIKKNIGGGSDVELTATERANLKRLAATLPAVNQDPTPPGNG